jgi:hypothetical protein
MKQFKNLDEALHYHYNCPVCGDVMKAGYSTLLVVDGKTTITFKLGDDSIAIDYYGDDIEWYSERNTSSQYVLDFFGIGVHCDLCSKYAFSIRVQADRTKNKVVNICLNSETLSIEKGEDLYEIKNIYSLERTEYDKFTKVDIDDGTVKMSGYQGRRNGTITFPLIPLDLKNPEKTLERIKGLIVFS